MIRIIYLCICVVGITIQNSFVNGVSDFINYFKAYIVIVGDLNAVFRFSYHVLMILKWLNICSFYFVYIIVLTFLVYILFILIKIICLLNIKKSYFYDTC